MRVAIFTALFGGFAEVWFRTVMPACEIPAKYQADPAAVFRLDPRGPTTGLFTVGRLCLSGGAWRVNGDGWNSGTDYASRATRRRPMVALFGDSFVEGLLTDTDQHVDAYLPHMLPGTTAYAFGISGWYLEQYVAVSRYAQARFQPDVLVFLIDRGDVSDSLRTSQAPSTYWWQIGQVGRSFEELPPTTAYVASAKFRVAAKSALIRYLLYNAKVTLPGANAVGVPQPATYAEPPGGNDALGTAQPADSAWRSLLPAASFMVDRLRSQHPGIPIIFAALSDRYLRQRDIGTTPLFPDARAVKEACRGRSRCSFVDLRYAFSEDWAAHHVRFEAADGAHWNAYGNRLVAGTLAEFIRRNRLLE